MSLYHCILTCFVCSVSTLSLAQPSLWKLKTKRQQKELCKHILDVPCYLLSFFRMHCMLYSHVHLYLRVHSRVSVGSQNLWNPGQITSLFTVSLACCLVSVFFWQQTNKWKSLVFWFINSNLLKFLCELSTRNHQECWQQKLWTIKSVNIDPFTLSITLQPYNALNLSHSLFLSLPPPPRTHTYACV